MLLSAAGEAKAQSSDSYSEGKYALEQALMHNAAVQKRALDQLGGPRGSSRWGREGVGGCGRLSRTAGVNMGWGEGNRSKGQQ